MQRKLHSDVSMILKFSSKSVTVSFHANNIDRIFVEDTMVIDNLERFDQSLIAVRYFQADGLHIITCLLKTISSYKVSIQYKYN